MLETVLEKEFALVRIELCQASALIEAQTDDVAKDDHVDECSQVAEGS